MRAAEAAREPSVPVIPLASYPPNQPYQAALRMLSHGLSRWAMHGLDDFTQPTIVALRKAGDALYQHQPHTDAASWEIACEAALRELIATFAKVYTTSDKLTRHEVATLWETIGYIDALDAEKEAAEFRARERELERKLREQREQREQRESAAFACFDEAQRERLRGPRNRQRQRREERTLGTAVAA